MVAESCVRRYALDRSRGAAQPESVNPTLKMADVGAVMPLALTRVVHLAHGVAVLVLYLALWILEK
jgi:hypothetical protein